MGLSHDRIYQIQAPVDEKAGGPSGGYVAIANQAFSSTIEQFVSPAFEKPEPPVPGVAIAQVPSENTKKLSFEILNGNGVEGAATVAANLLKQKGCTSVEIGGNASNSYVENQIYFREGSQAAADELATLFKPAVVSRMPPELNTKAQILVAVGTGFEGQLTEKQPEVKAALHFEQDSETTAAVGRQLRCSCRSRCRSRPASRPSLITWISITTKSRLTMGPGRPSRW